MTYPTLEETRDAELVEGKHLWIAWSTELRETPIICCRWCGICRRRDGKHNPCRGIVRIKLR